MITTSNSEFFEALALLEKEKGIPKELLAEKIATAIGNAIRRDMGASEDSVVDINPETGRFYVAMRKTVVDEVYDPAQEILPEEAVKYNSAAILGDVVEIPLDTKQFGRIAAQTAKHVIRQGIREVERGQLFAEYSSRQHDIVTATVIKTDPRKGNVTLEIGKSEAILPKSEQVPGEEFADNSRVKVYVVDVINGEKGPRIMISRIRGWSNGSSRWRSRRFLTAPSRSNRSPARRAAAPRSRSGRMTRTSTRSAPASARKASAFRPLWTNWAGKRSTWSSIPPTRQRLSRRRFRRPTCFR